MEEEIWRTYPEFDFIEVSNLGNVRTKDRYMTDKNGVKRFIRGRVLKQNQDRYGYMLVQFQANGKKVQPLVHRMVAICFIPNPDNLPEINHIDNDRTNNSASNLEWCTHKYNMTYREKCGVSAKDAVKMLRRPVIAVKPETSEVFWFESRSEAARQLGICYSNIYEVIKGNYNQTGGYWFCNADSTAVEKTRVKFGDKIADKVEELMNGAL